MVAPVAVSAVVTSGGSAVTTDHNGPFDFVRQPDRVFFGLSNHWFEAPLSKSGTDRLGVSRGQAPSRPRVQEDANPTRIQGEASTRLAERMMTCSSGTSRIPRRTVVRSLAMASMVLIPSTTCPKAQYGPSSKNPLSLWLM